VKPLLDTRGQLRLLVEYRVLTTGSQFACLDRRLDLLLEDV
jgi:hypothetical protein